MNTPPIPDETKTPPTRSWVWHCTEGSIAAGQISVLAALETLCAVGLYWWLSFRFEWHWFSMVGLIAAPMLLLRSEESVELGVEMLGRWWIGKMSSHNLGHWQDAVLFVMAGEMAIFLSKMWLPGHEGWALFWRAGVVGAFVILFASAGQVIEDTVTIAGMRMRVPMTMRMPMRRLMIRWYVLVIVISGSFAYLVSGGAVAGAAVAGAAFAGVSSVMVAIMVLKFKNQTETKAFIALLFGPCLVLGTILRALFIRWFASLRNLFHGIKRIPCNLHENLWVIDLSHPPELLPQAGRVDQKFTIAGLWLGMADQTGIEKIFGVILIPAFYLPALAYRWSIKASAWLWWPLALVLMPPFEGLDGYKLRRRAAIVSRGAWSKLLLLALPVLLAWLALSLNRGFKEWLQSLSPTIADFAGKLLTAFPPPPLGLRFGLLCLALVLAVLLLWLSNDLAASYPEVLDGPKGYDDLNDKQKADFEASARPMERLRLLFIVTLFLLVEAVALAFLHDRNPPEIKRLVWPWLLEWL